MRGNRRLAGQADPPPADAGMAITRWQRDLELPRGDGAAAPKVTLDSPIEDLALSRRARNALRKAGFSTIRSLFENDFSRAIRRLGPISREEIVTSLREHGFTGPAMLDGEIGERIAGLDREIGRLRGQIDSASQHWRNRLSRLEQRLKRLYSRRDPVQ